jgi:hypothetical protein
VRCIAVLYSKPFENFIAPHTTEYRYNASYADKWFRDLMNTIATLQDKPKRCALARENDAFPQEIRQLIFGKSRNKYRIVFTILEDTVYILYLRHSAQSAITLDILDLE